MPLIRMAEGLIHMRGTMISIMTGTIDMVVGTVGGGEEVMEVGAAAKSGMVEGILDKGLGEVVIMVVVEGTEEDMAVDTEADMEVGKSIGGIKQAMT